MHCLIVRKPQSCLQNIAENHTWGELFIFFTFTKASLTSAAWATLRGIETLSPLMMIEWFVRLLWSSPESTCRNDN